MNAYFVGGRFVMGFKKTLHNISRDKFTRKKSVIISIAVDYRIYDRHLNVIIIRETVNINLILI